MRSPAHLNALRAFEASARHLSFSAAAKELNVTPAAVGQMVRTLEDLLGTALFVRSKSGRSRLIITEPAARALVDIQAGFDKLTLGMRRLSDNASSGVLKVAVSPAFASMWLLPRLHRFQADHPSVHVRLDVNLKPVDFASEQVDIGVRYGTDRWPGLAAVKLLDEEVYPVCSPNFLRGKPEFAAPCVLLEQVLIHDLSMEGRADFPGWNAWFNHAGVRCTPVPPSMQINDSAAVLQAAVDGRGIALGRSVMAGDDLASGRLIRLFPRISLASALAYYVVTPAEGCCLQEVAAFQAWLLAEGAATLRASAVGAGRS